MVSCGIHSVGSGVTGGGYISRVFGKFKFVEKLQEIGIPENSGQQPANTVTGNTA
jgi:hypothetical protein